MTLYASNSASPAERPDPAQIAIWARMSPAEKLELARQLREDALTLKRAWLRQQDPRAEETRIEAQLRAWQLYGRTDLD